MIKNRKNDDTIIAPITSGKAPVSLIRISGKNSIKITDRLFRSNYSTINKISTKRVVFGNIINNRDEKIDNVLLTIMKSPGSYTGEDVIEISCHGNPIIVNRIIKLFEENGARYAEPGEFTRRAFLNNKMDLTTAESINDLINAASIDSVKISLKNLDGDISNYIEDLSNRVKNMLVKIEAYIEFPEDESGDLNIKGLVNEQKKLCMEIDKIIKLGKEYEKYSKGINIAIIGRYNVGKSSLFNRLLDRDRVITSRVPGTTRDYIKETIVIDNHQVNIIDTAGFKKYDEKTLDKQAVKKTEELLKKADVFIAVFDGSQKLKRDDLYVISKLNNIKKKYIIVINKIDLVEKIDEKRLDKDTGKQGLKISAKSGYGIDKLKRKISKIGKIKINEKIPIITSGRINRILREVQQKINDSHNKLTNNYYFDQSAEDIRESLNLLSRITGHISSEDILNEIFSEFCIGK